MKVNEFQIRKLIKESVRRQILNEAGFHKDIKPGETPAFFGSNKSGLILHKSKDVFNTGKFVLVMWPSKRTPNKAFKNLPADGWTTQGISLFHDGNADSDHDEMFSSTSWLLKNYYFPKYGLTWSDKSPEKNGKAIASKERLMKLLNPKGNLEKDNFEAVNNNKILLRFAKSSPAIKNFSSKVKKAYNEGRIRLVNVQQAQSNFEFMLQTGSAGAAYEFWTDTGLDAAAGVAEMMAAFFPPLKAVSDSANIASAFIKVSRKDILGGALSIAGLIPAVGDVIGIFGNAFTKMGAKVANVIPETVVAKLIKVIGSIVDGDLLDTFRDTVYWTIEKAGYKKDSKQVLFGKLQSALKTFHGALVASKSKNKKITFEKAVMT